MSSPRTSSLFLLSAVLISGALAASGEGAPADAELTVRLERFLDRAAGEGFTGAVLVARRGRILLERGYGERIPGGDEPLRADTV